MGRNRPPRILSRGLKSWLALTIVAELALFNRRTLRFFMTEAILFQPRLSTIAMLTAFLVKILPGYALLHLLGQTLAIPSFFEIKESDGMRKLSEKNRILFFRSPR
jgi:hypothetical protein